MISLSSYNLKCGKISLDLATDIANSGLPIFRKFSVDTVNRQRCLCLHYFRAQILGTNFEYFAINFSFCIEINAFYLKMPVRKKKRGRPNVNIVIDRIKKIYENPN